MTKYEQGFLKGSEVGDATARLFQEMLNEYMARTQKERIKEYTELVGLRIALREIQRISKDESVLNTAKEALRE